MHKVCSRCKVDRPIEDFNYRDGRTKRHNLCKTCRKDSTRKRVYGLEPGEYERKWEAQGKVCKICGEVNQAKWKDGTPKLLAQDHDHSTGLNRDLLCDRCNRGLGNFVESPALLRVAAEYLERWGK